jgi:hypothetical protein
LRLITLVHAVESRVASQAFQALDVADGPAVAQQFEVDLGMEIRERHAPDPRSARGGDGGLSDERRRAGDREVAAGEAVPVGGLGFDRPG